MKRFSLGPMVFALAAAILLAATPAFAGKPGVGSSSTDSVALATINGMPAAGLTPHLGDTVTFSYNLMENVKSPRIQVVCSQNGTMVYGEAYSAIGNSFMLGGSSSTWLSVGGPASCVATLYSWNYTPTQTFVSYASMSFNALGK